MGYLMRSVKTITLLSVIFIFLAGFSGCATSKQMADLEQRVAAAENTANRALQEAQSNKGASSSELQMLTERAERAAERAEACANKCESMFHKGMKK